MDREIRFSGVLMDSWKRWFLILFADIMELSPDSACGVGLSKD
jgi:hypothetical protein